MKTLATITAVSASLILSQIANAQLTVWTDGAADQVWSTAANWSAGVPTPTSAVQIGTQPTGDQIGIETGATTVASFTFNNSLTGTVDITAFGADSLTVSGAITNNSASTASFSLATTAGATATWTGPLTFSNIVNIGTNQITLSGPIAFSGTFLNFDITNLSTYGRFLGAGTATVTSTINIGGSYTGVVGNTFDLTTGNFSGATLGTLPTLTPGLSWDTSTFLANGTLTVIPEPSTWLLIGIGLAGVIFFRRRLA